MVNSTLTETESVLEEALIFKNKLKREYPNLEGYDVQQAVFSKFGKKLDLNGKYIKYHSRS